MRGRQHRGRREKALSTSSVKSIHLLHFTLLVHSITGNCVCTSQYYCCLLRKVQMILYTCRWSLVCTNTGTVCSGSLCDIPGIGQSLPISFIPPSFSDSHSTMSCVVSEELPPTPLEAVQVMVAKALSLITLVTLRVLVTLSSGMEASVELVRTKVTPSSFKSTPSKNQEMVGAGTPVAVHVSAPEAPSEKVTVGFWEAKMAASEATEQRKETRKM